MRAAGIHVCCGGIVGMGETREDRVGMIADAGEPAGASRIGADQHAGPRRRHAACRGQPPLDTIEFVRTIAVARITMPRSMVRLSAGRETMSEETQALCFLAGANSIFCGPKLLTTPNPRTRSRPRPDGPSRLAADGIDYFRHAVRCERSEPPKADGRGPSHCLAEGRLAPATLRS